MNANTNTADKTQWLIAFERAGIPLRHSNGFEPSLLSKIIKDNPNPEDLRRMIYEVLFQVRLQDIFDGDRIALDLAKFFCIDYPELIYFKGRNKETIDLIKSQVAKATEESSNHAFTEFITENFVFSKFHKLMDLIEEELASIPRESLSISFHEFALFEIFGKREEQIKKIFADCGFDYSTKYVYGEEKEVRLDGELRILINEVYNEIKNQ